MTPFRSWALCCRSLESEPFRESSFGESRTADSTAGPTLGNFMVSENVFVLPFGTLYTNRMHVSKGRSGCDKISAIVRNGHYVVRALKVPLTFSSVVKISNLCSECVL